jgi:hypothetical protein
MKLLRRIKAYLRYRKNRNFLKKNHCHTWRQYKRDYDVDIIRHATLVSQFYHGYPYIHYFEYTTTMPKQYKDWQDWLCDMRDWCEKNCLDKVRYDIHRVIREKGLIHNEYNDTMLWTDIEDFSLNDMGGYDILFFAFKREKDLLWFKLRWQ